MGAIACEEEQPVDQCRRQIHRLGQDFEELEKIAGERELPRDALQAIHNMARRQRTLGLSEPQLRERLNQLQEVHILLEHRVQPDLTSDAGTTSGPVRE